ncbi:MAG: flagellar basal body-associated FliL family protein [Deltaproteobacteria bacterium]|jgi:flagellar FliL protein|nr:flagellar basal body-associated FliL family protein [Deltaproteobacteria bacterium]
MSEKKAQEGKKSEAPKGGELEKGEIAAKALAAPVPVPKGGLLKIIIIAVAAMLVGGVGAAVVLKTVLAPAKVEVPETAEPAAGPPAHAQAEEEPIVPPTKGGSEVSHGSSSGGEKAAGAGAETAPAETGPITVELKPFTTNLNEPSGRRFLKVAIGLEVDNQEAADELNKKMSDIQDSILILLSSQSIEDIANVDGKERLRGQILNRVNSYMAKNKVKKVKYSDFVIQ